MILVTGGLGFVGINAAEALLELGETCVLTRHRNDKVPRTLEGEVGKRVFIEPADVTDADALMALGRKYEITSIVHLAGGFTASPGASVIDLYRDVEASLAGIASVIQAGHEWAVKRVSFASTLGVYNGVMSIPWREDELVPLIGAFPLEAFKKCGEILASYLGGQAQVPCVSLRLAAMFGPYYDASRGSLPAHLIHAAVKGEQPGLEGIRGSVYADDGMDQCYVKDAARAIALVQTAEKLNHSIYNVATGKPSTNQEIVNAVRKAVPRFTVELPAGHMPGGPQVVPYLDITRLREDTGFEPRFDIDKAIADYVHWLQAGHEW